MVSGLRLSPAQKSREVGTGLGAALFPTSASALVVRSEVARMCPGRQWSPRNGRVTGLAPSKGALTGSPQQRSEGSAAFFPMTFFLARLRILRKNGNVGEG